MENKFDELLAGWAQALNEIGLLAQYQRQATVVKYATDTCFKLEDFTPDLFPSGVTLSDEIPAGATPYYEEYGLGPDGFPCYSRTLDKQGQPVSAGFYRYAPEAMEYVQYNLSTGVPYADAYLPILIPMSVKEKDEVIAKNGGLTYDHPPSGSHPRRPGVLRLCHRPFHRRT